MKSKRLSFAIGAAVVAALTANLLALLPAAADFPTVAVGSTTMSVGEKRPVDLDALSSPAPGLGAWTIDVAYDPAVVAAVDCTPRAGGFCNEAFAPDSIRATGAAIDGLEGDSTLATVIFQCRSAGASDLTVHVIDLFDATPGGPQPIDAAAQNGQVTCTGQGAGGRTPVASPPTATPAATATPAPAAFPHAGGGGGGFGGDGSSPQSWLIAGLAGAGVAWLIAGLAGAGLAAVTNRGATAVGSGALARRASAEQRQEAWATPAGNAVLRVSPIDGFSDFVDTLAALSHTPGIARARAVRLQRRDGVFEVATDAPFRCEELSRAVSAALRRPVRVEPEA